MFEDLEPTEGGVTVSETSCGIINKGLKGEQTNRGTFNKILTAILYYCNTFRLVNSYELN